MASDAQRELVRWFFAEESRMGSGVTDDKFRSLDANGDGFLTRDELLPALGATLRAWGNYGTTGLRITEAVIAMADTDHDGKVSLAEFLALGKVLQEVAALKAVAERHRKHSLAKEHTPPSIRTHHQNSPTHRNATESWRRPVSPKARSR